MLRTVAAFSETSEAHMLRGRLEAEGLLAFVSHEFHVGNNWAVAIGLGGAKAQVSDCDEEEAKSIVGFCNAGDFKSLLAAQLGDLDDRHCPNCGSTDCWKRRPVIQAALAIVISLATGAVAPPLRWVFICNVCGTRFKSQYGLIGQATFDNQFGMTFAEAKSDDIAQMIDVRRAARENILRGDADAEALDYDSILRERGKGWVCKDDGIVRAFSLADRQAQVLRAVFVDPYFKRCGIGRKLHTYAVDWLFDGAAPAIRLTTEPGTGAEKFFRKAGWRLEDSDASDDYLFQLEPEIWSVRRKKF